MEPTNVRASTDSDEEEEFEGYSSENGSDCAAATDEEGEGTFGFDADSTIPEAGVVKTKSIQALSKRKKNQPSRRVAKRHDPE